MATKAELETENQELQQTNKTLQSDLKKMSNEMQELKKMIQSISKGDTVSTTKKIDGDEEVTVVSLCIGTLSISTEGLGKGVLYEFSNFGDEQEISFSELRDIVRSNRGFAENLIFYIKNEDVVKKLHLTSFYNKYASDDEMRSILSVDPKNAVKIYEKASAYQKENIVLMLTNAKLEGRVVDANILSEIGRLVNKDLINID